MYLEKMAGPEGLVLGEIPKPNPKAGEVLIKVHATAVMPSEFTWFPTFKLPSGEPREFPIVLSHEVSGKVRKFEHWEMLSLVLDDHQVCRGLIAMNLQTLELKAFPSDAVIVATPTGSTAYSLGAGGPILKPDVNAFVITPVSPHGLTHRPVVVRDSVEIEIQVKTGEEEAYLSLDGQVGMPVNDGDTVRCVKAEHPARLLRFKKTFFEVLSTKLKWGER